MKRANHHWHVKVDELGRVTGLVIEHDHLVNPNRRHAHYYEADGVYRDLVAQGVEPGRARRQADLLDGRPEGSLDLSKPPTFAPDVDERDERRRLHPDIARQL